MKGFIILYVLLHVTPILSITFVNNIYSFEYKPLILEDNIDKALRKRGEYASKYSQEYIDELKKCRHNIEKYGYCLYSDKKEMADLNNFCNAFFSEECVNFFSKSVGTLSGCRNKQIENDVKEFDEVYLKIMYFIKYHHCITDEKGNFCPLNIRDADNRRYEYETGHKKLPEEDEKELYYYVNETCKSKSCIEGFVKYKENLNDIQKLHDIYTESYYKKKESKTPSLFTRNYVVEDYKNKNRTDVFLDAIDYLQEEECQKYLYESVKEEENKDNKKERGKDNEKEEDDDDDDDDSSVIHKSNINVIFIILSFLFSIFF